MCVMFLYVYTTTISGQNLHQFLQIMNVNTYAHPKYLITLKVAQSIQ